jgi:hypothetical protein
VVNRIDHPDRGFERLEGTRSGCGASIPRIGDQGNIEDLMPADPLKLIALDADDLAVISAHVQDARVQASDIVWRQDEKRLVVGIDRLDWEQTLAGGTEPRRSVAALRFDRVLACKARNIDPDQPEAVLELVGIEFHPGEAPGGSALLLFSQGQALRLDVECLECELTDLGTDDLGASDLEIAPEG